jgi:hypothetical protein
MEIGLGREHLPVAASRATNSPRSRGRGARLTVQAAAVYFLSLDRMAFTVGSIVTVTHSAY